MKSMVPIDCLSYLTSKFLNFSFDTELERVVKELEEEKEELINNGSLKSIQ